MQSNQELYKIVSDSIANGSEFYREFSSRFFGALIGEMMLSELERSNKMELEHIVKTAKEIFQGMQKAEAPDKATA